MCGIMGYYCFSEKKPDKQKIADMFGLLETRGRDASGFAFIRDGGLIVQKAPIRSTTMIHSKEWKELDLPQIFIAHTRMKTQGTEKNNANNHPLFSKTGICIVHNGMIHNDKEIFGKNRRDAEVDSEAILAVLSSKCKGDKIKHVFEKLEGSFAFAMINKNDPGRLVLVKKDNPLELYLDTESEILYFCSERDIMRESLGIVSKTKLGFNIGEISYHHFTMENNYSLVLNKDGVESYRKYMPKRVWRPRTLHEVFDEEDDPILVQCPYCLSETTYFMEKLYNRCGQCGMEITEDLLYEM